MTQDFMPLIPSETLTLHAMTDSMASSILSENEKHIRPSLPVTADWVMDGILAKEARGIDCTLERRAAKQYFAKPEFTPLRGMSLPELADPGPALLREADLSRLQVPDHQGKINAKGSDGVLVPTDAPEAKKGPERGPVAGSVEFYTESSPNWEDVPF